MVDFKKLMGKEALTKELDPIAIFERLDKQPGKEYLRPPQSHVLKEWHQKHRNNKDTIVKLRTGHGKTLVSLIMLQSYLNEKLGPAVYLCPNNYLVDQTVKQAKEFGIKTVQPSTANPKPLEFLNSESILITTCSKLFNGKSIFGVAGSGKEQIQIGAVALDDAHKCMEIIRTAFSINVKRKGQGNSPNPLYTALWALFQETLNRQAAGTCLDIFHGEEAQIAVPFWAWYAKQDEVLSILREYKETLDLTFVWDLIKDNLKHSMCIFSGTRLQITPRLLPLEMIPSFTDAKRRIFLSATLTEDAFLVKDLGLDPNSVTNPLSYVETKEGGGIKYDGGERMIVIPTLVDPSLKRERIIDWVTNLAAKHGTFGVVSIVPSFMYAKYWEYNGAIGTNVDNLEDSIDALNERIRAKDAKKILVLVNEYDGIDLPDSTCRILCLDTLPVYNSLIDSYQQEVRPNSTIIRRQLAQRVEQGMGRGIRGINDWSVVVIIGNNITDFMSEHSKRSFLSNEAQMQIKIAEVVAGVMKTEGTGLNVMEDLIDQCLNRKEDWKEYYIKEMDKIERDTPNPKFLNHAIKEREAEKLVQQGHIPKAVEIMQELVEKTDPADKGWYFQLMVTYLFSVDPTASMDRQVKAFSENHRLFRPETGISYSKANTSNSNRESLIIDWIRKYESSNSLIVNLNNILDKSSFNGGSDLFEEGIQELGKALGLISQRPEQETGKGPDNLWHISGKRYWIISCKNMVQSDRSKIFKKEAGQMNNDIAWFKENHPDGSALPVFIHPARNLEDDAFLSETAWVIVEESMEKLKKNIRNFYTSISGASFDALSVATIKQKLKESQLDTEALAKEYLGRVEKSV